MRMWMVNPQTLCKNHLMGEHYEIHKLIGNVVKNRSIEGYVSKNLIEVHNIPSRHDELVKEMLARGYNHFSEIQEEFIPWKAGKVDLDKSLEDLLGRCSKCKERHSKKENNHEQEKILR